MNNFFFYKKKKKVKEKKNIKSIRYYSFFHKEKKIIKYKFNSINIDNNKKKSLTRKRMIDTIIKNIIPLRVEYYLNITTFIIIYFIVKIYPTTI